MSRLRLVFGFILAATLQYSCAKKIQLIIAVVPKAQSPIFWQKVHAGALAAGEEFGVVVTWNGPATETDFIRQINIVDELINQRVSGIALAPIRDELLVPVVERAAQEKIPVTIFDSGIKTEKYVTFVTTDNYRAGILAARRMGKIFPAGGKAAVLAMSPDRASADERENGFRQAVAREFPSLQIVEFRYGMGDREMSRAAAEGIIDAHQDLTGIFCSGEEGTAGAVEGTIARGLAGKVKLIGFGANPELIRHLQAGRIDALVLEDPFQMGYLSVKSLVERLRGQVPERHIDTGATLVTIDNLLQPNIQKLVAPPTGRSFE